MQIQLDPNIPANLSQEELRDFKTFIDIALDGLTAAAGGEVFATGNAMLAGSGCHRRGVERVEDRL